MNGAFFLLFFMWVGWLYYEFIRKHPEYNPFTESDVNNGD